MLVLCREVDKATGRIAVYPINAEVTDQLLFTLGIRQRLNPELRYFVTTKANYTAIGEMMLETIKERWFPDEALLRVCGAMTIEAAMGGGKQ